MLIRKRYLAASVNASAGRATIIYRILGFDSLFAVFRALQYLIIERTRTPNPYGAKARKKEIQKTTTITMLENVPSVVADVFSSPWESAYVNQTDRRIRILKKTRRT